MKIANITLAEMTEALNREGWATKDSRIAMVLQEERAGVEIKVTPDALKKALERDPPI
jgi:3-hydroxyisobutyrate dehydrogenase